MSQLSTERGFVGFKTLFVLLVLSGAVYAMIMLLPPFIDAERMKDEMAVKARLAQTLKNEEILADLVRRAGELNLPLGQDDFQLKRDETARRMSINAMWDIEVQFLGGLHSRTLHFEADIDESYARQF